MQIEESFLKLKEYCEKEEFKGWDPYDGLNSKVFNAVPGLNKSRFLRLAWIQLFKKSPVNFRKLLLVKKDYNAKGLGLFLNGYCNLYNIDPKEDYFQKIKDLADKLLTLQSESYSGACWGYNFDWQARAFFQPKYTPTVVATTFIGYALLDAYDITKEEKYLNTVISSSKFILEDLNKTYDEKGNFAFSYSPIDKTQVFNASLLGSRLLSRIYSYIKDETLIVEAKKSVQFCCNHQKEDGSWGYGTLPFHQWIDNFHTGYNLECIHEYQKYSEDNSFQKNIDLGLKYYLETFFTEKGESKYYNNSLYPIDIHAPAQLIVTLFRLGVLKDNINLCEKVAKWTIDNMQNKSGFFNYQKNKTISSNIPYIRWAQSWMFYSLSYMLRFYKE
jgi:rhamnogalacturonyl hydrolase YesR